MATFVVLALDEARRAVLPARRAIQEQYREYVRGLDEDTAGKLELTPDDRPITERARLKAAAKAEGINLHIQRSGTTVVFWETAEPPKTRSKAPAKSTDGGGRGPKKSR